MSIPYELRVLLQNESVINLTLQIFEKTKNRDKFKFYPEGVNSCLNKAYSNQSLYYEDEEVYKENINLCCRLPENKYIELLIKNKVIKGKYEFNADGANLILDVKKIKKDQYNEIVRWAKNKKYIINSGLFSLNTLSGEAYFKNNKSYFRTSTGYYYLFRELLTTKKDYLSFDEIVEIQQQKKHQLTKEQFKEEAKRHIKHLRRKLKIGAGTELFKMNQGIGYTLQANLVS